MPYCTQDDILKALPEQTLITITDDEGAGTIHAGRVAEAIAAASAEIDGWCEGRYTVPFADPAPALVKKFAVDIAIYNLYARRQEAISEARAERYQNAQKLLERINRGDIVLGADVPAAAESSGAVFVSGDRLFTRDTLKGM